MSKLSRMTHITPLPSSVTREAAIAYLQNHPQMIELNPLVLRHERTDPHRHASSDEAEGMLWYEITDMIQYIPGTPIKGEVSYKAGFYDLSNGLQTHTFAPGGVDLRGRWTVGGNAPGEEPEEVEIGLNKPKHGLYIREDVDLRCNRFFTNFIKKNLKKSHSTVVDKIVEMASTTEDGNLHLIKPTTTRSDSDITAAKLVRSKRASHKAAGTSTPTSYSQTGSAPCACPMVAFGVHMEACDFYQQPRQSQSSSRPHSRSRSRPQSGNDEVRQTPRNYLGVDVDVNPIGAQQYHAYPGGRPVEME